jgi:hypothetical protein
MLRLCFSWLLLAPLLVVCATAQTGIEGTVRDAAGSPVVGARAVLRRPESGNSLEQRAMVEGDFVLPRLRLVTRN